MNINEDEYPRTDIKLTSIDSTSIPKITSSVFLKPSYATCTSPLYRTSNQEIPIDQFNNVTSVPARTLKQVRSSVTPLSAPQLAYWTKIKLPKARMLHELSKPSKTSITLPHSNLSGAKIITKNKKIKFSSAEINKNFIDNDILISNQYNIPKKYSKKKSKKIDIYHFDHGNSEYFLTTDVIPILLSDKCADRIDNAATRFWAEIFGTIHIGMTFITAFILQLLRFILRSIIRPLLIGTIQMTTDYMFKPLLTIIYNGILQPTSIFSYNIASSLRDLCKPVAEAIGYFFREFANLLRAIKLIEINSRSVANGNHHHNRLIKEPT